VGPAATHRPQPPGPEPASFPLVGRLRRGRRGTSRGVPTTARPPRATRSARSARPS